MFRITLTPQMTFEEASCLWLQARSPDTQPGAISARHIRQTTELSYRQYIGSLNLFFSGMRLGKINFTHFAAYQKARLNGGAPFIRKRRPQMEAASCPVNAKKVNQELWLLKNVITMAGCWNQELVQLYRPLLWKENDAPRALSTEEQQHWLQTAQARSSWDVVYLYSLVAFDTCLATNEFRGLRVGDINLQQRVLSVPRQAAKNKYRARTIELVGADVLWGLERLLERARLCGAHEHQHYLFPFREKRGDFDPSRPMTSSGIKKPWNEVRKASELTWFTQYDTRHTAITRHAERGTPIAVIKSFAGHISNRMSEHYTHISQSAQRMWRGNTQSLNTPPRRERASEWRLPPDNELAIQQEVERRLAIALQQQRQDGIPEIAPTAIKPSGPRLIAFPSAG